MHTITNNYRDAHILNLGSGGERGPYLVTQTGVSPKDAIPKTRMFVLRLTGENLAAKVQLTQIRASRLRERVNLYLALGGDFEGTGAAK